MAKYDRWTLGETEALLNMVGGVDRARAVLRGELKLSVGEVVRATPEVQAVAYEIGNFKFLPFLLDGESGVVGDTMVTRANGFEGSEPGEVEGRWLLDNQKLIPEGLRVKHLVITGWRRSDVPRYVECLYWNGGRWIQRWGHLGLDWGGSYLVVRLASK